MQTDVDSNSYNDHFPISVQHRAAGHFRDGPITLSMNFIALYDREAVPTYKSTGHNDGINRIYTRPLHEAGAEHQVINPVDGELTDFRSPCVARSLKVGQAFKEEEQKRFCAFCKRRL